MDADYRRPIKANRYWSRPKARVYDCNMRDAERIYKDNYKEYLAEKDFRLRRDREWSVDTSDRFAHLRAGPVRRREASAQPLSRHNDSSSLIEGILSRASAAHEETESSEPEVTIRTAKPVPAYDPQKENQSLEERLARLKRLREDLGLPHDTESSKTTLRESRDSASRTFPSDNDTSSSYKSERTSRLASRAGAGANGEESSYSFKSERSSKLNGIGSSSSEDYKRTPTLERKREEVNITPRTERKSYVSKAESNDDYSYKGEKKAERYSKVSATTASSSSPVRTRKAVAAKETLELDDEDDAMMAKMMKKLPSSQEILERISKMDLDD